MTVTATLDKQETETVVGAYAGELATQMVRAIRAAAATRSSEDTRPTLRSVYLDGPAGVAVATDSYAMAIVPLPEGHQLVNAFQLPCDVVTALCKVTASNLKAAERSGPAYLSISCDGDKVTVTFELGRSGQITVSDVVTSPFPNWDMVTPDAPYTIGTELPALNPTFTARMVKVAAEMGGDESSTIQLVHAPDMNRAAEWQVRAADRRARFVQMPVRLT
jgi:hypothetical protein